jgi:hydrogenase expression/formation protein HypE
MSESPPFPGSCPMPRMDHDTVILGHGGGGRLMQQLLENIVYPAFRNTILESRHDGAVLELAGGRLAFTTDSYVVKPLFFPGGDIGSLAVNGTVNDLAMCGADPRYLSAAFIVEEGLPMDTLRRITVSMRESADAAGVTIVTGDTKVVDRGKGDGIFINTAGVGIVPAGVNVGPHRAVPGDAILVSGDVGRHGIAIMAMREGLSFESTIESDCAPLAGTVRRLREAGVALHCLRDCTRGGLGAALIEVAETAAIELHVLETAVPIREDIRGACEILGLDPFTMACEGRFLAIVPEADAGRALAAMQGVAYGVNAAVIGRVDGAFAGGRVVLESTVGAMRLMDLFSGEQLPRIC